MKYSARIAGNYPSPPFCTVSPSLPSGKPLLGINKFLPVIQNHLQFVAISNLEAATFQVSYQLKILTTAAFSVLLLRKQLSSVQWFALALLAIGVGVVQIQSSTGGETTVSPLALGIHKMNQMKGLIAVITACFTSGLAGVYFEMVLKNSPADLWTRNVQLSMFSLLPALSPIILSYAESSNGNTPWTIASIFHNFGVWAWATVLAQVAGGLVTALVIKYADNILKGFATSLSIVMSFLASVALFDFVITTTFLLGSVMVLVATWLYNQPQRGGSGTLKIIRMGRDVRSRGKAFFSPRSCNDETVCMHSLSTPCAQDNSDSGWEQKPISQSSTSFGDVRNATSV
jgi:UDP-sugar transporter A1/2/3